MLLRDYYLSLRLLFRVRDQLTLLSHHYAVKSLQLWKQTDDSLLVRIEFGVRLNVQLSQLRSDLSKLIEVLDAVEV